MVNGTSPRPNFDDFPQAFVTIFLLLIGDNWNNYMYVNVIALGSSSCLFFVAVQIFGKYVLLNLFLAILLENFEDIDSVNNPLTNHTNQSALKDGDSLLTHGST